MFVVWQTALPLWKPIKVYPNCRRTRSNSGKDLRHLRHHVFVGRVGDTHDMSDLGWRRADGTRVSHDSAQQSVKLRCVVAYDVFPLTAQHPVRIEFFDDEIDTIRRFDAFTQESIAQRKPILKAPWWHWRHLIWDM